MVIEKARDIRTKGAERWQRLIRPLRSRNAEKPSYSIVRPLSPEEEKRLSRGSLASLEISTRQERGAEREVRLELAQMNVAPQNDQGGQKTPEYTPKSGVMYRFYTQLKERREHPQSTGKAIFDVAAETLGFPLILIPGMQWLALIPWGPEYTTGDALNIGEAVLGRTLGGKKLTPFERILYVGGGLAPIIPGRVVVGLWETIEDKLVYPVLQRRYAGKQAPPSL